MKNRHTAAARALDSARAASAYVRATGCDIGEAGAAVADAQWPRRSFLAGGLAAGASAALPAWLLRPPRTPRRSDRPGAAGRVVIIGAGIAGLGCAYRLWQSRGIASEVYEYNPDRAGGRVQTLRGYFDAGQYAEEHAEFISSEHTATRQLARGLGLTLDDVGRYRPGTHPDQYQFRFGGRSWSQQALDHDWHAWGWRLFHDAAFTQAPWPTLHDRGSAQARRWDAMSCADWIGKYVPGGIDSDFGRLCVAVLLDEFGGPVEEESALNLVYLLGMYDSAPHGRQPRDKPQLSGTDEKWHVRGGNDQLISGLIERLQAGTVRLGSQLVALSSQGHGRWRCTFAAGAGRREVVADQVVLALPFTRLRDVRLRGADLPPAQLRAIREEPLGPNSKIQMQFSRRVWNADGWTANAYTDELAQGTWETTIDQPGPYGILIALPGGATGADLGRRYRLTSPYGPAPAAMVADYLRCYERFWPGVGRAYSGKAYYAWSSGDPYIGGAYSYLKVGQYTAFNGIQGRQHGSLHFAGEQTSVNFQGFIEGGLRSGYRCAAEIIG